MSSPLSRRLILIYRYTRGSSMVYINLAELTQFFPSLLFDKIEK